MRNVFGQLALAVLLGAAPHPASAQAEPVDLEALRTPTSPVFALLGKSPISIERPTSVRAFAATLVNATNNLSRLPQSYAIDVGPYWLSSRPALTFDEFYRPTVGGAIAQTLSISLATAPIEGPTSEERLGTYVGVGFRLSPLVGDPSPKLEAVLDSLDGVQQSVFDLLRRREDATSPAAVDSINAVISTLDNKLRSLALSFASKHYQERVGFKLDFAGAALAAFPGDVTEDGEITSVGLWATASYRGGSLPLEAIGLGRLIWGRADPTRNWIDVGGRLLYHAQRLGISAEFVNRTAFDVTSDPTRPGSGTIQFESSSRIAGIVEYSLGELGYLFATFGQDYELASEAGHRLLAVLGVNFALGDSPQLLPGGL